MLMGFSCIGHAVWVFSGAANLVGAGCGNADLLIVDSASLPGLPGTWLVEAQRAMRNPAILIHDRATFKLHRPS